MNPHAQAVVAAKKRAKAGNYVMGPQTPKYRDPKSGATWSGRGRAPAWLSGAKDRSKFLIVDADASGSGSKAVSSTKATVKQAATKKVKEKALAAKNAKALPKPAPAKKAVTRKTVARKTPAKRAPNNPVAVAPASESAPVPVAG
ncbi:H-NS family nucleoid-associated regulatory protein [Paraburkholderia azotifigens]|uniref:H-NS family nucleoid-associated regulatory protein n=2 Tax=Paraburkholderia azotifigens TaxID=2057004 RepID=A0ABU9QZ75_9BURK|nr:H-NS family nucleoid-associated regulatory protein [Paraburkholderia azotifigens]